MLVRGPVATIVVRPGAFLKRSTSHCEAVVFSGFCVRLKIGAGWRRYWICQSIPSFGCGSAPAITGMIPDSPCLPRAFFDSLCVRNRHTIQARSSAWSPTVVMPRRKMP